MKKTVEELCYEHSMSVYTLARVIGVKPLTLMQWEEEPGSVSCRDRLRIESAVEALDKDELGRRPDGRSRNVSMAEVRDWEWNLKEKTSERERERDSFIAKLLMDILTGEPLSFDFSELESLTR